MPITEMNPEQQRIDIAEACGWILAEEATIRERDPVGFLLNTGPWWRNSLENTIATFSTLPDYYNDLNAMHEAEKTLCDMEWIRYTDILSAKNHNLIMYGLHASASEKAEAFLKAIRKWKDPETLDPFKGLEEAMGDATEKHFTSMQPNSFEVQSAFEKWLEKEGPSGDVGEVQKQWEESSDYQDLFV